MVLFYLFYNSIIPEGENWVEKHENQNCYNVHNYRVNVFYFFFIFYNSIIMEGGLNLNFHYKRDQSILVELQNS